VRRRQVDGFRPPPVPGQGLCLARRPAPAGMPDRHQLLHVAEVASGRAPTTGGLSGQTVPPVWRACGYFRRPRHVVQNVGLRGQANWAQSFLCQFLTQARVPHDREVDVAGNGRRPADILLKAWDWKRDLAVDLTILYPNPATGRPLRGSAATFLKDKGEQRIRESADSCGRMEVNFSPVLFGPWGGLHGAGKSVVKAVFARCTASLFPCARPAAVGALGQGFSVQLDRLVAR